MGASDEEKLSHKTGIFAAAAAAARLEAAAATSSMPGRGEGGRTDQRLGRQLCKKKQSRDVNNTQSPLNRSLRDRGSASKPVGEKYFKIHPIN